MKTLPELAQALRDAAAENYMLRELLNDAAAAIDKAATVLQKVEWQGGTYREKAACPDCLVHHGRMHAADCGLAHLVGKKDDRRGALLRTWLSGPDTADVIQQERAADRDMTVIAIETRVPSKWRFVDLETGDVWKWQDGTFKRA